MNIKHILKSSYNKGQIEAVANFACLNEENFKTLFHIFIGNDTRMAQMASWSLSYAVQKSPHLIQPYLKELIEQLSKKDKHNAVIRNTVRILQDIEIPKKYHGKLMNCCFSFIELPNTPVAIKAFSLAILFNLSTIYPEIKHELMVVIEDNLPHAAPAFKNRGNKILLQLKK